MMREFEEFIAKRCEKALMENEDYMLKEKVGEISTEELQEIAEIICYKKGFEDAIKILKNGR